MSELKYNELRKGNLLYFPFVNSNVEVIGINSLYGVNEPYFNKLSVMEGLNMYYEVIEVFKPIPLTEEWLLKFGFSEKLGNWELPNFRFHINKPMNFDGFLFCEGYSVTTDKIQFVHQLQNLYFALTGEELILNQ